MDIELLKNAMKRRRGHGVDIKLIIEGAPEEEHMEEEAGELPVVDEEAEDQKLLDVAPEVKDKPVHADEEQDKELMRKELKSGGFFKRMMAAKK